MNQFKAGDRVVVVSAYSLPKHYGDIVGKTGTVVEYADSPTQWEDEHGFAHVGTLIKVFLDEPMHSTESIPRFFTDLDFFAHELALENVNL